MTWKPPVIVDGVVVSGEPMWPGIDLEEWKQKVLELDARIKETEKRFALEKKAIAVRKELAEQGKRDRKAVLDRIIEERRSKISKIIEEGGNQMVQKNGKKLKEPSKTGHIDGMLKNLLGQSLAKDGPAYADGAVDAIVESTIETFNLDPETNGKKVRALVFSRRAVIKAQLEEKTATATA